ncbi:MAG: hypothetical protein KDJ52_15745 [Anaerolineae bacterium]|nr:hypothetical protein [Anaerolineae bacterium]
MEAPLYPLGRNAQSDSPQALARLDQALALAAPEGYVRIFLDEGGFILLPFP